MTKDLHCWAQNAWWDPEWCVERSDATCMLPECHEGPHEFTPDEEIIVRFAP